IVAFDNYFYPSPLYTKYRYAYQDHLGSIVAVTDDQGNVVAEQNFDAWGRERNPQDWTYNTTQIGLTHSWLYRGYTGHEHMPHFSIINMNGRMYDPILGRMMSPDPYIMPGGTQGLNRYSYCLNNPLKYTDQTGEYIQLVFGAVMGGLAGWQIGKANGATGGEMWKYIGLGAGIGAATAGAGTVASLLGGGAMTAGAVGGVVGGAGFSGLQSNWDKDAMLKGAAVGG